MGVFLRILKNLPSRVWVVGGKSDVILTPDPFWDLSSLPPSFSHTHKDTKLWDLLFVRTAVTFHSGGIRCESFVLGLPGASQTRNSHPLLGNVLGYFKIFTLDFLFSLWNICFLYGMSVFQMSGLLDCSFSFLIFCLLLYLFFLLSMRCFHFLFQSLDFHISTIRSLIFKSSFLYTECPWYSFLFLFCICNTSLSIWREPTGWHFTHSLIWGWCAGGRWCSCPCQHCAPAVAAPTGTWALCLIQRGHMVGSQILLR